MTRPFLNAAVVPLRIRENPGPGASARAFRSEQRKGRAGARGQHRRAIAGVALPLHQAGIALFDAICARDFRAENDLLPALGLAALDRAELHRQLRGE